MRPVQTLNLLCESIVNKYLEFYYYPYILLYTQKTYGRQWNSSAAGRTGTFSSNVLASLLSNCPFRDGSALLGPDGIQHYYLFSTNQEKSMFIAGANPHYNQYPTKNWLFLIILWYLWRYFLFTSNWMRREEDPSRKLHASETIYWDRKVGLRTISISEITEILVENVALFNKENWCQY